MKFLYIIKTTYLKFLNESKDDLNFIRLKNYKII